MRISILNDVDLSFGRRDATGGLLLKCVEHIHHASQLYSVDHPIGVTIKVFNDLNQAAEIALKPLCLPRMLTALDDIEGVADFVLHGPRKIPQVIKCGAHPFDRPQKQLTRHAEY